MFEKSSLISILVLVLGTTVAPVSEAVQCFGSLTDEFTGSNLAYYWQDASSNGSAIQSNNELILTRNNGSVSSAQVVMVQKFGVCGDFDISIDYRFITFPAAVVGSGRFQSMVVVDQATGNLIGGVERYREQANACVPSTDSYKLYTTVPGCTPDAIYVPTTDTQGKFRLKREGSTLRGFYWNGSGWTEAMTRTASTAPVRIVLYSGTNGSLMTGQQVAFDNLVIQANASLPGLSSWAVGFLGALIAITGVATLRRRRLA